MVNDDSNLAATEIDDLPCTIGLPAEIPLLHSRPVNGTPVDNIQRFAASPVGDCTT